MHTTLPKFLSVLVGILALGIGTTSVMATSLIPLGVDQLTDHAELIFSGTALHEEVVATEDGSYAYTFVTFEVDEVLKGEVADAHLTLRFDGGTVEEVIALRVSGMPTFDHGERYVLFVAGNGEHGCPVLGWSQGKLDFRRHPENGAEVLVDRTGALIEGLDGDDWRRSKLHVAADGTFAEKQPLLAEVVSEEGVEIIAGPALRFYDTPKEPTDKQLVAPSDVLDELRQLVQSRAASKSYSSGQLVASASPLDIPATKVFSPVTIGEEN